MIVPVDKPNPCTVCLVNQGNMLFNLQTSLYEIDYYNLHDQKNGMFQRLLCVAYRMVKENVKSSEIMHTKLSLPNSIVHSPKNTEESYKDDYIR